MADKSVNSNSKTDKDKKSADTINGLAFILIIVLFIIFIIWNIVRFFRSMFGSSSSKCGKYEVEEKTGKKSICHPMTCPPNKKNIAVQGAKIAQCVPDNNVTNTTVLNTTTVNTTVPVIIKTDPPNTTLNPTATVRPSITTRPPTIIATNTPNTTVYPSIIITPAATTQPPRILTADDHFKQINLNYSFIGQDIPGNDLKLETSDTLPYENMARCATACQMDRRCGGVVTTLEKDKCWAKEFTGAKFGRSDRIIYARTSTL